MRLNGRLVMAALCACLAGAAASAGAQTSDDLFDDQVLQRIDVHVNTRDWYWLKAESASNTYYTADLKWRGQTVRNVGLRSRGSASRSAVKPGLRVDINRYVTGQTFLGLTSFVLDNLETDASCLREMLAMKLLRRMGVPAPREAFAALFVNNAFAGLYAVVESIDETAVDRLFGEHQGYLFEYQWTMVYNFEYLGAALEAYAPMFQPVNHKFDAPSTLYGPIEAMVRTINDAPDPDFATSVEPYLDLGAFVRMAGGQAFLAEEDGLLGNWGVNNFYFYRFQGTTRSRFIAWDADHAMTAIDYDLTAGHNESVLMRRVMQVPDLRAAYWAAVLEAAALADEAEEAGAPGWLEREVVRFQAQIGPAVRADTLKPYSNEEFEQASAYQITFARQRGAFVRCEVRRLGDPTGGAAPCSVPVGSALRAK